jgi:hypothetical protein
MLQYVGVRSRLIALFLVLGRRCNLTSQSLDVVVSLFCCCTLNMAGIGIECLQIVVLGNLVFSRLVSLAASNARTMVWFPDISLKSACTLAAYLASTPRGATTLESSHPTVPNLNDCYMSISVRYHDLLVIKLPQVSKHPGFIRDG